MFLRKKPTRLCRGPFLYVFIETNKSELFLIIPAMRQLIKPYLVQNTSLIMSIFPIKGRYQKKNDFRAVMKVGAVVLEFIPKIKDNSDKNVGKQLFS